MKFTETPLSGCFVVEQERRGDDRGHFARVFCTAEFAAHGLCAHIEQANAATSRTRGTLRGLHFQRGQDAEVGVIGAGYMGRGLVLTIIQSITGMQASAVYNRTLSSAAQAYEQAGVDKPEHVTSVAALEAAIEAGRPAIADDPMLLCEAGNIDCIVESTGEVEFGAQVTLRAIEHGKHVVLLNAELDAVVGPILKRYADQQGVTITNCDGDQPGVVMNLYRWVKSIGYEPLMCGNIKGLQDNYRTPATQKEFADRVKQKPKMITSFADGTKISMEMVVVANATGFKVGTRGMYGPECKHVTEAPDLFDLDQLRDGGMVDYILGAEPGPGVFVLGYNENPILQQYASYLKMGEGPLYTFYVPYHLPHLETPLTVARASRRMRSFPTMMLSCRKAASSISCDLNSPRRLVD